MREVREWVHEGRRYRMIRVDDGDIEAEVLLSMADTLGFDAPGWYPVNREWIDGVLYELWKRWR